MARSKGVISVGDTAAGNRHHSLSD